LSQITNSITHGKRILDKLFISWPSTYTVRVVNCLLKTKHKVVTARVDEEINIGSSRKTVFVYDKRQHNIDYLRHTMATSDWSVVNNSSNVTEMYSQFLNIVSNLVDQCIPKKTVHLVPRDPEYFTPLIKQLLIKRNRFMHRGNLGRANEISLKLNLLIKEARSQHMSNLANADTKRLWQAVSGQRGNGQDVLILAQLINSIIISLTLQLTNKQQTR